METKNKHSTVYELSEIWQPAMQISAQKSIHSIHNDLENARGVEVAFVLPVSLVLF